MGSDFSKYSIIVALGGKRSELLKTEYNMYLVISLSFPEVRSCAVTLSKRSFLTVVPCRYPRKLCKFILRRVTAVR